MTTYPVDNTASTKPPGPRLALALIVIAIGTVLGIGGLAIGISKVVHEFTGSVYTAPGTVNRHFDTGTYEIFEQVAGGVDNPLLGTPLTPSDVRVTSSSGETVPTTDRLSANENIGRGSTTYEGVIEFKITQPGDYTVIVSGNAGEKFFVTSSFGDLAKHAAIWFVLMGLGMLIGFTGVVLLIVGIVRRRKERRPPVMPYTGVATMGTATPPMPVPQATGLPAAGWYPDPQIPGATRWWDGTRWTDQTQNS
jgi:Protein of unknown function (DUF2510)